MAESTEPGTKVEFGDSKLKQSSRWTRLRVTGVLTVLLLIGVVVSLAVFFTLKKTVPNGDRLVDVNLEEGDTVTYRVDQDIEMHTGSSVQIGTNLIIVGIRVLNKSSEEYWFLVNFTVSQLPEGGDINDANTTEDYYLVRLRMEPSSPNQDGAVGESFEIYGDSSTDGEQLRLVFSILQLLLPSVRRDLYENVDGSRNASASTNPEESPLLPGPVMMHREANTSGKDTVSITNHFSRADMVDMPSDVDMGVTYSDQSSIKKSNGMVSEAHAYLSQWLNFAAPILGENGADVVTMMKMTVKSRVSLIETVYFSFLDLESVSFRGLLVKLILPKPARPVLTINETESQALFNESSKEESSKRVRRTAYNDNNANASLIAEIFERIGPVCLFFDRQFQLYTVNILSFNLTLTARVSVKIDGVNMSLIEVKLELTRNGQDQSTVFLANFTVPLQDLQDFKFRLPRKVTTLKSSFAILGVSFAREWELAYHAVDFLLSLPLQNNSLNPPKLKLEIMPVALVKVSRIREVIAYYGYRTVATARYGKLLSFGPEVTLTFCDGVLCVNVSNGFREVSLKVGFSYERRICIRRRLLWSWRRKLVCVRFGWRLHYRVPSKLLPSLKQEEVVIQVCNVTKSASSSIILPTPTSQSMSMTNSISASTSLAASSLSTLAASSPAPASSIAQSPSLGLSSASIAPAASSPALASSIAQSPSLGPSSASIAPSPVSAAAVSSM